MTISLAHRGAATVAVLDDYDGLSAAAVLYLRMWCDGPETQTSVMNDLIDTLGRARGHNAIAAFAELCSMCVQHGRRPLCRHGLKCRCVGADEASFAHFVATAADGEREDAMLIAMLLVRPDMAPALTSLATDVGLALKQMNLAAPKAVAHMSNHQPVLH
ncbi:MAG: hypothetical protein AAFQ09_13290 [Pseudomonadota bacterium]